MYVAVTSANGVFTLTAEYDTQFWLALARLCPGDEVRCVCDGIPEKICVITSTGYSDFSDAVVTASLF